MAAALVWPVFRHSGGFSRHSGLRRNLSCADDGGAGLGVVWAMIRHSGVSWNPPCADAYGTDLRVVWAMIRHSGVSWNPSCADAYGIDLGVVWPIIGHAGAFNRHSGLRWNLAGGQWLFAGQTAQGVGANTDGRGCRSRFGADLGGDTAADRGGKGGEGVRFRLAPE